MDCIVESGYQTKANVYSNGVRWMCTTFHTMRHSCCTEKALATFALEATLKCGGRDCPVALVQDAAAGAVHCNFTAPSEGLWRLQLLSRGVHLKDSPMSVRVRAPPCSVSLLREWLTDQANKFTGCNM